MGDIIGRSPDEGCVPGELFPVVGVAYESQGPVPNEVDGRLMARHEQEQGIAQHLVPRQTALLLPCCQRREQD